MILIINLNPSIDKWYHVKELNINSSYNIRDFKCIPGGDGTNVAKVIKEFNESVMVTGFIGRENGRQIEKGLDRMGIRHRFIPINEESRSVIRILDEGGKYLEITEDGPSISVNEVVKFYELYRELMLEADMICACGNLPSGLPDEIYRDLTIIAKEYHRKFFLDTSGEALKQGIKALPFFIKPNREELEHYLGCSVKSDMEIIQAGKYLSEDGISTVMISLGENGAIAFRDGYIYRIRVPKVDVKSQNGAGDSMLGGFVASLYRGYDFEFALRVSAACGTANVMESDQGKVDMSNMKKIMNDIVITKSRF